MLRVRVCSQAGWVWGAVGKGPWRGLCDSGAQGRVGRPSLLLGLAPFAFGVHPLQGDLGMAFECWRGAPEKGREEIPADR